MRTRAARRRQVQIRQSGKARPPRGLALRGYSTLLYAEVERALGLDLDHLVLGPHGAAVGEADLHPQQPVVLLLTADGYAARDHLGGVIDDTDFGRASRPRRSLPLGPERLSSSSRVRHMAGGVSPMRPGR